MTLSLSQKILYIYPQLVNPEDWEGILLESDSSTNQDRIVSWEHSTLLRPTEEQLNSVSEEEFIKNSQVKLLKHNRSAAYQQEADPLFFKYQAGEVEKEEWLEKREEIRQRYPYPS
jgi:hypothetical protein